MTKSQNTKKEQQKDLCITSEQLTEMMKKGDLPHDIYYVICSKNDTVEIVRNWVQTTSCLKPTISYEFPSDLEVKQVLAPVPSYEEWQASYNCMLENEVLRLKNAQLKELLKECIPYFNALVEKRLKLEYIPQVYELLTKINEVLK